MEGTLGRTALGGNRTPRPANADFTVSQLAPLLCLTEQAVYRKIRAGEIPAYRIGSSVRIRREDVEALRQPKTGTLTADLAERIHRAVDTWPPLTSDQRDAVAAMFNAPTGGDDQ